VAAPTQIRIAPRWQLGLMFVAGVLLLALAVAGQIAGDAGSRRVDLVGPASPSPLVPPVRMEDLIPTDGR